jgi:hypothetical protein
VANVCHLASEREKGCNRAAPRDERREGRWKASEMRAGPREAKWRGREPRAGQGPGGGAARIRGGAKTTAATVVEARETGDPRRAPCVAE